MSSLSKADTADMVADFKQERRSCYTAMVNLELQLGKTGTTPQVDAFVDLIASEELDMMPLYINDERELAAEIARWRMAHAL